MIRSVLAKLIRMESPNKNGPSQSHDGWLVVLAQHLHHGKAAARSAVEVASGNAAQERRPTA